MLGKTNISTLSEGAIVTEIEDFKWVQMQSGIYGNFVKAIYKNNYLAAITADGTVVYTTDGEVWQTSVLEYEDCKLNDVDWDGSRFILVGSYTDASRNPVDEYGLILCTTDFVTYEKVVIPNAEDSTISNIRYDREYIVIYPVNGKYIIVAKRRNTSRNDLIVFAGDLVNTWDSNNVISSSFEGGTVSIAKSSNEILLCYVGYFTNPIKYYNSVCKIAGNATCSLLFRTDVNNKIPQFSVFECKDELFYRSARPTDNYKFVKVLNSSEEIILSTDINYMFIDGVYFNSCQLFINNHEMMVVKKGESLANKTLDDLIEIAPELTMNCITKAFGQLYIFGNQGAILKSSVETNNENAIAVQTLSAKKALADAKAYSDERYVELEARIIALEAGQIPE